MNRKNSKYLALFSLVALLALVFVPTVSAFEERSGNVVVIEADEIIEDDLYVGANIFRLEGTVKGDVIVGAQTVTINGTVEGDLLAVGQSVIINGTVQDDVRIGGAALELGPEAQVGDDLVGAGASLYAQAGSLLEGSLIFAGGQALLAGAVDEDVFAGTGGLEISGRVGGDVRAEMGEIEGAPPINPYMYIPEMPAIPTVNWGLTLGPEAEIGGDLAYTSHAEMQGAIERVAGEVEHRIPTLDELGIFSRHWVLDKVRRFIALVVAGLLGLWLTPNIIKRQSNLLRAKPGASAGWGLAMYVGFPIAMFAFAGLVVMLVVILTLLTLGNLGSAIFWLSLTLFFLTLVVFSLMLTYVTKVVVGYLLGHAVLQRIAPTAAESMLWSLLLGLVLVVLFISIPLVGWLFNFTIMLVGLGTFWLALREDFTADIDVQIDDAP